MSLDGYVSGPDVSPEEPMGRRGEALYDWMFKGRSATESEETAHYRGIGAVIVVRRMADLRIGPTYAGAKCASTLLGLPGMSSIPAAARVFAAGATRTCGWSTGDRQDRVLTRPETRATADCDVSPWLARQGRFVGVRQRVQVFLGGHDACVTQPFLYDLQVRAAC
jgi:hypothetical protein